MAAPNLLMRLMAFGAPWRLTRTIERRRHKGESTSWSARRIVDSNCLVRLQPTIALIEELRYRAHSANSKRVTRRVAECEGPSVWAGGRDDRRVLQRVPQ
jgi:hypothetical protein